MKIMLDAVTVWLVALSFFENRCRNRLWHRPNFILSIAFRNVGGVINIIIPSIAVRIIDGVIHIVVSLSLAVGTVGGVVNVIILIVVVFVGIVVTLLELTLIDRIRFIIGFVTHSPTAPLHL